MRVIEHSRTNTAEQYDTGDITIVYALTVDEHTDEETGTDLETYGVMVKVQDGDSDCIRGITASASRIYELIELLSAAAVTPVTLRDVVYDWLEK